MQKVVRWSCALLAALSVLGGSDCRAAQPTPSARAYILLDAESGRVLLGENTEQELAIASTTKIMTALVALERGELSDTVTVKENHLKEGSSMYLRAGEELTLEALLYGLMLPSGNDAAECIAEHCGGSVEAFVARMNEKAAAMGLTHTAFQNPSGLDAAGHHSCARDMAALMAQAMQDPTFARIVSTRTAHVGAREMANHNKLLASLTGCVGGKTGYTGAAGRTLVTCCERDGLRLIAVTLDDRDDWADHAALYDYGFSTYSRERAAARGALWAELPVEGGAAETVRVAVGEDCFYPLAAGETVNSRAQLPETLSAPLAAGQEVGRLTLLCDGEAVGSVPLVCAEDVAQEENEDGWLARFGAWLFG